MLKEFTICSKLKIIFHILWSHPPTSAYQFPTYTCLLFGHFKDRVVEFFFSHWENSDIMNFLAALRMLFKRNPTVEYSSVPNGVSLMTLKGYPHKHNKEESSDMVTYECYSLLWKSSTVNTNRESFLSNAPQ